jgi:hypothetical protein
MKDDEDFFEDDSRLDPWLPLVAVLVIVSTVAWAAVIGRGLGWL